MKRFAAVAMVLMGVGFPLLAQRGGMHGGFGGHVSAPARGGFGASGPIGGRGVSGGGMPRFTGGPRNTVAPQRPPRSAPRMSYGSMRVREMPGLRRGGGATYPGPGSGHGGQGGHDGNYGHGGHDGHDHGGHDHYRHAYVSIYSYGYPYAYGFVPWVAPWGGWLGSGYSDYSGYDDSAVNQGYQDPGYYSQPQQDQYQDERSEPRPAYQPQTVEPLITQTEPSPAATLIFKDGRAPEQIHNYLLSRTTVFVMDKPQREIPVAQLDVAATEKVNRGGGVDFHLPAVEK